MMTRLEFRLLGPVEFARDGVPVRLGGLKSRMFLATLMLNANRVVPLDRLIDILWDREPPTSAAANVRTYAATVRRALDGRDDCETATGSRLVSRERGYCLGVAQDELDLLSFEALSAQGRAALADRSFPAAARHLEHALALWRDSQAAAGLPRGTMLGTWLNGLDEQRLAATEDLLEARLALGEHAEVTGSLRRLLAENPLRERLWAHLMLALYRLGDVAAALECFKQAHTAISGQLGVDPGPELTRLQRAMLERDPGLMASPAYEPVTLRGAERVPRELPLKSPLYGRVAELGTLLAQLPPREDAPVVVNLFGPAGSGKSALAVAAGHVAAPWFPDGQLYLDLAANDGDGADRVGHLLRACGEFARGGTSGDASRLRSALAHRRMLLVLDNAESAAQVRPLLPALPGCAVIVTGRRRLAALDVTAALRVGPLALDDAVRMLAHHLGFEEHGTPAARELAELCGRIPLALRIAAGRILDRQQSVADFTEGLRRALRPLDELALDDLSVREALLSDYSRLSPEGRKAFIGLQGDTELAEAQLVERLPGGAFHMPALPRLLASELA